MADDGVNELQQSADQALTIQESLRWASAVLEGAVAHLEAEIILAAVLQKQRSHLFAYPETELTPDQQSVFKNLIERRQQGEPVAYLTGSRNFWTLNLQVNPHTLIPRSETEHLVEQALQLEQLSSDWQVLDLGTGCGAIALALAAEKPGWQITAVDISIEALTLARENAQHHQLNSVKFLQSDWFSQVKGPFDLIVSNPPYVAEDDPHLAQGDVRHEPLGALVGGKGGLEAIRQIMQQAKNYLQPGGYLLFEHGFDQGADCRDLLDQHGYTDILTLSDLAGLERCTKAQFLGNEI